MLPHLCMFLLIRHYQLRFFTSKTQSIAIDFGLMHRSLALLELKSPDHLVWPTATTFWSRCFKK